jgi:hypothetical protein
VIRDLSVPTQVTFREERMLRRAKSEGGQKQQNKRTDDDRARELRLTTPDAIHRLRELIRGRYALDYEIWARRAVLPRNRPIVVEKMKEADRILQEIIDTVKSWEDTEDIWTPTEWQKAMDIRKRVLADGKRWWTTNPPWAED